MSEKPKRGRPGHPVTIWTPELDARLVGLTTGDRLGWGQAARLAEICGVTPKAIKSRMNRLRWAGAWETRQ